MQKLLSPLSRKAKYRLLFAALIAALIIGSAGAINAYYTHLNAERASSQTQQTEAEQTELEISGEIEELEALNTDRESETSTTTEDNPFQSQSDRQNDERWLAGCKKLRQTRIQNYEANVAEERSRHKKNLGKIREEATGRLEGLTRALTDRENQENERHQQVLEQLKAELREKLRRLNC